MTEYKISVIEGDGIGPELTEATLKVLAAAQAKFGPETETGSGGSRRHMRPAQRRTTA